LSLNCKNFTKPSFAKICRSILKKDDININTFCKLGS
jgi:hypothetical protein